LEGCVTAAENVVNQLDGRQREQLDHLELATNDWWKSMGRSHPALDVPASVMTDRANLQVHSKLVQLRDDTHQENAFGPIAQVDSSDAFNCPKIFVFPNGT
jgi:hypothetical protein